MKAIPEIMQDLKDAQVTEHSYRTARVGSSPFYGECARIPRCLMSQMQRALAEKCGVHIDNHQAFSITVDGWTVHILFTDSRCIIGDELIKESW